MVELCQIAKNAYGGLRTNNYGQGGVITNINADGKIEPTKRAYGGLRTNIRWNRAKKIRNSIFMCDFFWKRSQIEEF